MPSPYPAPPGRTARRLEWPHLPPEVRAAVEDRLGAQVASARSCNGGFTPGFASVLETADGRRTFVKAASAVAQAQFAEAYRIEARNLERLPPQVRAPRLRWTLEHADWLVLGIDHVDGASPARPWRSQDLATCFDLVTSTTAALTPVPPGLELATFAEEFSSWPAQWTRLLGHPDLPQAPEAAALAAAFAEVTAGESLVHTDIRDDNLLLTGSGEAFLCDWNWPVRGAAWLDPLLLLIGPRGDGLDVGPYLEHPALADVPAEHIDVVLALVTGYFLVSAQQRTPSNSPYIRQHQHWQGEACWEWLSERRGWN